MRTYDIHDTDADADQHKAFVAVLHATGGQVIIDERDFKVADSGHWVVRFEEVVDGSHRGVKVILEILE